MHDFEQSRFQEVILRGDSGRVGEPKAIPKVILITTSSFQQFEIRSSVVCFGEVYPAQLSRRARSKAEDGGLNSRAASG